MAAQLQPTVQFAVVREQHTLPIGADQPRAGGEVPLWTLATERVLGIVHKCAEFGSQRSV